MIIEKANNGRVHMNQTTLTDGSLVYDVAIIALEGTVTIPCIDKNAAEKLMLLLDNRDDYLIE